MPGVFVFGSNDYFAPILRNPFRYLLPDDGSRNIAHDQAARGSDLRDGLLERPAGWT